MSLNGTSTQLVLDDRTRTWHEQQDSGDRVQYLTGTAANTGNGTYDNGYWVVTTTDGTQYYFGKNKGPGWATGDPVTNSAFTAPVYGAHSGDPCFSSSGFSVVAVHARLAVESGLRDRSQRQRDGVLLPPRDQLLRRQWRHDWRAVRQGRLPGQDRLRPAGRVRVDLRHGERAAAGGVQRRPAVHSDPTFGCTAAQFTAANAARTGPTRRSTSSACPARPATTTRRPSGRSCGSTRSRRSTGTARVT